MPKSFWVCFADLVGLVALTIGPRRSVAAENLVLGGLHHEYSLQFALT